MQIGEVAVVRYWSNHKALPEGWADTQALRGTHHAKYATIIRMVK